MRKQAFLLSLCLPLALFSQKKVKFDDVVSNAEAKVLMTLPLGNNSLAKDLQPFYGFGFAGNLMTPVHFGLGAEYDILYSNVKAERKNTFGNLGSPKLTQINVFLTHREILNEDFHIEELAGVTYFRYINNLLDGTQSVLRNDGFGFLAGAKALYTLDPQAYQAVFAEMRFQTFSTQVYNENTEIQKYYDRSFLLTFTVGYRFNF